MRVKLSDGTFIVCQDIPEHTGAEGEIYLSADGKSVVKLYHNHDPNRLDSLRAIIGRFNAVQNDPYWRKYLCWPDGIVMQPRLGVKMPLVPETLKSLNWYILPKARARLKPEDRGTWDNHVLIALRLSRSMRRLHQLGLCHSDLSRNNCLVDPVTGNATIIDLDGLVVPGILPPQVVGTPEFMAPEVLISGARPSIFTDQHALAVLIYQSLLFRHPLKGSKFHSADVEEDDRLTFGAEALYIEHPSNRSNWPKKSFVDSSYLGPSMHSLMRQAFVDGLHDRARRPLAASWESELVRLIERLLPCGNRSCEGKYFPWVEGKPTVCPWCRSKWNLFPKLAVLDLYRPVSGRTGHYQQDGYRVVSYPGRQLFEWHTLSNRSPRSDSDPKPKLSFQFRRNNSEWQITNLSEVSMQILQNDSKSELKSGNQASLYSDMRILLGTEPHARIAEVHIVKLH